MQEEPNREESSRLRRIPVRGSDDSTAEQPTVENPTAADPAEGDRVAENPATGSWETGEAGRADDRPGEGWDTRDPLGYPEERGYGQDRMQDVPQGTRMGAQDEQTWSVLAHLSVLVGLIGLMPFGALIIWLVYKDRSPRVGFHALQALWYQIAWLVIFVILGTIGVVIGGILAVITLGLALFLLVPLALIIGVVPFIHGCYAAYQVSQGVDYRYPYIADRVGGPRRTV